jgi:Clustered mitochondria
MLNTAVHTHAIYCTQAAGHELRGLCHYANAGVQGLHFAPTCLIDYKGFRLVCAAVLPLGPNSLVSGSPDGGRTVTPVRDAQAAKLLSLACHRLNLRSHICRYETVYSGAGKIYCSSARHSTEYIRLTA